MELENRLVFDGHFLEKTRNGGIARDSKNFFLEFIANGWSVHVLDYTRGKLQLPTGSNCTQFSMQSFRFETLKSALTPFSIKISEPNLAFFYKSQFSPISIKVKGRKLPAVIRVHDMFPITNPEWFTRTSVLSFKLGISRVEPGTILLANSQSTLDSMKEILGSKFSNFTASIIPCKQMTFQNLQRCEVCQLCRSTFLQSNFLLAVGTIEPRKNYSRVIKAWNNSKLPKHGLSLVIVGKKGWKNTAIVKQIFNSNQIHHVGDVCDFQLNELYDKSLGFLSGSINEGYNIPLDEARSKNKILLLSNISVHRERVNQDSAVWFEPENMDSIIDALNSFHPRTENIRIEKQIGSFKKDFTDFSHRLRIL